MTTNTVARVGFWSALLSAICAVGWGLAMIVQTVASPPAPWTGAADYVSAFEGIQLLNLYFALPLASAFTVLMVSIHVYAAPDKKVWSMIGLAFTIIYATMASINYLIQLISVRQSALAGETDGLAMFAGGNPHAIFYALAQSYAYMSLAMLFAAWVFGRQGLEGWIRRLFIIVGLIAPVQFAYGLFDLSFAIVIVGSGVWTVGAPAALVLLAVLFRRAGR